MNFNLKILKALSYQKRLKLKLTVNNKCFHIFFIKSEFDVMIILT